MKNFLLKSLAILSLVATSCSTSLMAQTYNYTLNGNPINTTGWTMGGNASNATTHIELNNNAISQNGYIYYGVPQNLNTACDYFSVAFSFRITTTPGIQPADGFAFWYIANPPSAFVSGAGMGMPSSMNGFALIFDVYDNNSNTPIINVNPLITLRKFVNQGYQEGVMTGLVGTEVTNQQQIKDGNWHTALLEYNQGVMSVFIDGGATPIISGPLVLSNSVGYFGFSASTGALYERHAIKDVIISGGQTPDPVTITGAEYCQYETATRLAAVGNLPNPVYRWYDSPTGGTASLTAPLPNANVPGTYTWYATQSNPGCPIESPRTAVTVTVHPKPVVRISPDTSIYCSGGFATLNFSGTPNVVWTPNQNLDNNTALNVKASPTISTVYRAIGSSDFGCKDTAYTTIIVHPSDSIDIYKTIDEGEFYMFLEKKLWDPGVYKRRLVTTQGCDSIVVLHLNVDYKDKRVAVPNAFSPNGDGKNDFFKLEINYPGLVNIDKFNIYNRWGQAVYSAYGLAANSGWDGTLNDKPCDAGIYFYKIAVKINGEVKDFNGEIHLIR